MQCEEGLSEKPVNLWSSDLQEIQNYQVASADLLGRTICLVREGVS